jgi:hypothetical protein
VIDSAGKKLGPTFAGQGAASTVAFVTDSGLTLLLSAFDSHIAGGGVYFESTDCTGAPFMGNGDDDLTPTALVVGPRRAVHTRSGNFAQQRMSSVDWGFGECTILRERFTIGRIGWFAPAAPIGIELADYFTPPFRVRAGKATRKLPAPAN